MPHLLPFPQTLPPEVEDVYNLRAGRGRTWKEVPERGEELGMQFTETKGTSVNLLFPWVLLPLINHPQRAKEGNDQKQKLHLW